MDRSARGKALLALASAVIVVVGCSSGGAATPSAATAAPAATQAPAAATAATESAAPSAASLQGKIVARAVPAVQQVESQFDAIAKEKLGTEGVTFQTASADGDSAKQRTLVEQFIAQGVNALMQTNLDMSGWDQTYKDATDKGIAVINMSGAPISNATVNFNQDQDAPGFKVGEYVGNWLKDKHDCQGVVGFMTTVTIPAFQGRTKNAETKIHEICPEVTFIEPVDAYTPEMGAKAGGNLIQTHPELTAIVSVNDDAAVGAFQAIQEAGKTDPNEFMLTGYDATPEGQKLIEDGSVFQMSWSYAIPYWAAQGAQYAMDAMAGKPVPASARVVGTMVTKDNLADYKVWSEKPLDPANAGKYDELIDESDVVLASGQTIGEAFK